MLLTAVLVQPLAERMYVPFFALLVVVGAFSAFLQAEEWLQVSGVMAVLATGFG